MDKRIEKAKILLVKTPKEKLEDIKTPSGLILFCYGIVEKITKHKKLSFEEKRNIVVEILDMTVDLNKNKNLPEKFKNVIDLVSGNKEDLLEIIDDCMTTVNMLKKAKKCVCGKPNQD